MRRAEAHSANTAHTEGGEPAWRRIQAMRGLAFKDTASGEARGLSWSDFAVLFRSVKHDAGELVEELRKRDIPYVIKGLNRLFDSPEIQAIVGIFEFVAGRLDEPALHQRFAHASLLPSCGNWAAAMAVLNEGRDFGRGDRWGVYNIQRVYLEFLEALELREETVPGKPERAELVFYQLGKFSRAISDFEAIYFNTDPEQKYQQFADWLTYPDQAPSYYADADAGYAMPDAVVISTVHQAKGMQWPAVFVPCLRSNRFPAKRQGGVGLFHVIPDVAVSSPDRYRGTVEDETRLFYVAVTRAQKYLSQGSRLASQISDGLDAGARIYNKTAGRIGGFDSVIPKTHVGTRHLFQYKGVAFTQAMSVGVEQE